MQLHFGVLAENLYDDMDSDFFCYILYGIYMLVCKGEGIIAIFISSIIMGVLLAQAFNLNIIQGFYIYHFLEVLTWIIGVILLKKTERVCYRNWIIHCDCICLSAGYATLGIKTNWI